FISTSAAASKGLTWQGSPNGSKPARLTSDCRDGYRRFFRPPRGTRRAAVLWAVRAAVGRRRPAPPLLERRARAAAAPARDAAGRDDPALAPARTASPGSVNTVGSYQDHSRVVRQRRYTVPPGRRGASCVVPHDLQTYNQAGIRVPPYRSFVPLIISLNSHPSNFAARRHMTMRGRKISKYSITWDRRVAVASSRVIVRAVSSTRRNECSTA